MQSLLISLKPRSLLLLFTGEQTTVPFSQYTLQESGILFKLIEEEMICNFPRPPDNERSLRLC